MRIEELREDDIGTSAAWIPRLGKGPESMARITYPGFAQLAFYKSVGQVRELEFSTRLINQGSEAQSSIGLWFISIEAYINSLLRIACLIAGEPFDDYRTKDFGLRIRSLFEILGVAKTPYYSGPFQRLEEFKRYRNELFHDRTNKVPLAFSKTSFGGDPMSANQVDVIQACIIALETYGAFRYIIPGLDLMPQIRVTKGDSFFHDSVGRLYDEVLRPFFEGALDKHGLTTNLDLNPSSFELASTPLVQSGEVQIIMKSVSHPKFEHPANGQQSNMAEALFDGVRRFASFNEWSTFKMPDYYRR